MNPVEFADYWRNRYQKNEIGWDCGEITTPLKEYIDQLTDKSTCILIPGCGNAYEAEYLWLNGFHNTYVLDFAPEALDLFSRRVPDFPKENLITDDFFNHQAQYDLIIEQTMFCAINPNQRIKYAQKTSELLHDKGKLVGVLFNRNFEGGPPFGGSTEEYNAIFSPYFSEISIEPCFNSIKPRSGTEVFIKMIQ
jgi:SAM-dependent methyltransferase